MSNPWESEPSYVKTGGLQYILDVNKRFSTYERSDEVLIITKHLTSVTSIKNNSSRILDVSPFSYVARQ